MIVILLQPRHLWEI